MMRVYAAKQVGPLSYFVKDLSIFYTVIKTQQIKQSNKEEFNPRSKENSNYISLSRNMTAAAIRNNTRWRYGITIDGDKLSNRYHIEPFSFMGSSLNRGAKLAIKDLTAYDDGSCKLRLVNWPAMVISRKTFDFLESLILKQDAEFNRSHKLVVQEGGKRKVNGHYIEVKYNYNVKHGDGCKILSGLDEIPTEIQFLLTKGESTNEYEERIWTSSNYIDISGCITGIILPEDEIPDFESVQDDETLIKIREILDARYGDYKIMYY